MWRLERRVVWVATGAEQGGTRSLSLRIKTSSNVAQSLAGTLGRVMRAGGVITIRSGRITGTVAEEQKRYSIRHA